MKMSKPVLMVVSAPSGAGKTTLCSRLMKEFESVVYSISCTTRAPRGAEQDGVDYFFLTHEQFDARVAKGDFLEYATVHGNSYGTLKETLTQALGSGRDVLLDIDVQGAALIRAVLAKMNPGDALADAFLDVFITPPSMEELRRRLCGRGTDAAEAIEKRLAKARHEMDQQIHYAHVVVNDDLDQAYAELRRIFSQKRDR
jgi:guanylate kinase